MKTQHDHVLFENTVGVTTVIDTAQAPEGGFDVLGRDNKVIRVHASKDGPVAITEAEAYDRPKLLIKLTTIKNCKTSRGKIGN